MYSNSENVAQLLMIFSDFVRFLATSGQLLTVKNDKKLVLSNDDEYFTRFSLAI